MLNLKMWLLLNPGLISSLLEMYFLGNNQRSNEILVNLLNDTNLVIPSIDVSSPSFIHEHIDNNPPSRGRSPHVGSVCPILPIWTGGPNRCWTPPRDLFSVFTERPTLIKEPDIPADTAFQLLKFFVAYCKSKKKLS